MVHSKRLKWLLVIAITMLAAFLRLYQINVLPPGETFDPAYYGLDALEILSGKTPIFFETNLFGGREPLFSYIVAACVAVLGVGSLAIHVAAALVGILTIPAVYLAAEEVFADERGLLAKFGGLVAALTTTLSFWHLSWSRYGVRAILTPLFAALVIFFLWRGLRTKRWWLFAGCGLFLGLSMYTYQAARLLPVLVVVGFGYATWRSHAWNKASFYALGIITLTSLLVFAPLGYYAITHPDNFMGRVDTVSVFQSEQGLDALGQELENTLLVFGFQGDSVPTTNSPGRPALNPFFFSACVLGMAISLWRLKRPSYALLLAWLAIMCIPGVLAQYGETAKRIIGSLPAVFMLIAVGLMVPLDGLLRWVQKRPSLKLAGPVLVALVAAVILAGLVYSGIRTYTDYFVIWGEDPALFTHFEAGLAAIGQYAAQRPAEEQIYVSPVYVGHPSILYNSQRHPGIKGYHGEHCIILPDQARHDTTYVIVPSEDSRSIPLLDTYLPDAKMIAEGPLHYEQPYFYAYEVPAGSQAQIAPTHRQQANWDNQIALLGYDIVPNPDDQTLLVRLYYKALAKIETDYTVFIQIIGPDNPANGSPVWSQIDSEPCQHYRPTSTWAENEILVDDFVLSIPDERPVGEEYDLIMGFYDWRTLERLPVLTTDEQGPGDYVVLVQRVLGDDL